MGVSLTALCEKVNRTEPEVVRALMGPVLEQVRAGELWLADRNFSTRRILFAIHDKKAAFIIRGHGVSPSPTELEPLRGPNKTDPPATAPSGLLATPPVLLEPLIRRVLGHAGAVLGPRASNDRSGG